MIEARDIARLLSLEPHSEGGFFRETFRSAHLVATPAGPRSAATGILFLVTAASPSRFHRLRSDELWLYHVGVPLELVVLLPDGSSERVVLAGGDALAASDEVSPQALVPGGAWQAAHVQCDSDEGEDAWTLVSCIVTPGFDYADFELAGRDELVVAYPLAADLVRRLT
jgi:predicted cupin superfamily sugar epimerase